MKHIISEYWTVDDYAGSAAERIVNGDDRAVWDEIRCLVEIYRRQLHDEEIRRVEVHVYDTSHIKRRSGTTLVIPKPHHPIRF